MLIAYCEISSGLRADLSKDYNCVLKIRNSPAKCGVVPGGNYDLSFQPFYRSI